jgi:superfamily II helicase
LELVEEDDHQRLQTVLQSAKEMAQQQGGVRVRPGHGGLEEMQRRSVEQQKDLQLIRT